MDKIYSRTRIRIPKIRKRKPKKIHKIRNFLILILLIVIVAIGSFIYAAYPILIASCETAAGSRANHIVNEEVSKVMSDYTYNDLIDVEKDGNGEVVLMKSNTVLINQITSKIVANIQKAIDNTPRIMVYINYGSVSGVSVLKNLGPKFDIELEAAGRINTELKSEFEGVNVNQTLHKIYLNLNTSISILTPVGCFGRNVDSKVLLTEAVIVGDVPETFYNLEGLNRSDALEVME